MSIWITKEEQAPAVGPDDDGSVPGNVVERAGAATYRPVEHTLHNKAKFNHAQSCFLWLNNF